MQFASYIVALIACLNLFSATSATYCRRAPPRLIYGSHNGGSATSFKVGSVITYSCNSGYRLQGQRKIRCIYSDGSYIWDGRAPKCIRSLSCSKPTPLSHGVIVGSRYTFGSFIKYICNDGYKISGKVYRKCLTTGWTGSDPKCVSTRGCPSLNNPQYGEVTAKDGRGVGAQVWYTCNTGFTLVGSESRTCTSDLIWNPKAPICKRIRCRSLNPPDNGAIKFSNGRNVGSKATYSCDSGYVIKRGSGDAVRVCRSNGRWSGDAPVCIRSGCGSPDKVDNGGVIFTSTDVGSTASYSCNDGYTLVGATVRRCQRNGKWTPDVPICKRIRCPSLNPPDNGAIKFSNGRNVGSKATYSCDSGYVIKRGSGDAVRVCRSNGLWSGDAPVCIRSGCGSPDKVDDGRVIFTSTDVGSTASYLCNDGYTLVGATVRRCQRNGKWTPDVPICKRIRCRSLNPPDNGAIKFSNGRNVGSKATYSCDSGYVIKRGSGDAVRVCRSNGRWSGDAPVCIPVDCFGLENPRNGRVLLTSTTFRSIARYECDGGYELVGNSQRRCQINGKWSGEEPLCRLIVCEDLPDISQGSVSQQGNTPGSTATYSCITGYELVGNRRRTCQVNREWSGDEPSCRLIVCEDLPDISQGSVSQQGNTPGSTATYSCITGYELVGNRRRTCQVSREWSGDEPSCRLIVCEDLPDISQGSVSQQGNTPGSTATYSCITGYELVGNRRRTCQVNREWSGDEPSCRLIVCEDLPDISQGSVSQQGNTPGSTATYSCITGYELVGNRRRTCQVNREWSGDEPSCRLIVCEDLPDIPQGSVSQQGNTPGSTATYSCITGYELVGNRRRTCQVNREWSGDEPSCRLIVCEDLPDISQGSVSQQGNTPGSTATYSCITGYELVGNRRRTCQVNREWSGDEPSCRLIVCEDLPDISQGSVSQQGNTPGSTATYSCITGYELVGNRRRTCQVNREWSGDEPSCRLIVCEDLPDIPQGSVSQQGNTPGSTATYSCITGYRLSDESSRQCQDNGQWSGNEPTCIIVDCNPLPNILFGNVLFFETTFGSTASYLCIPGFTLVGPDFRICQANGLWSGEEPSCQRDSFDCGPLRNPENGVVDTSDGTLEDDVATYQCNPGFNLKGVSSRTCTIDGWSDKEPTCEIVDCGELLDPEFGVVLLSGTVLGSTASYDCFTGYTLSQNLTRTCQADGVWSEAPPTCIPFDCLPLDDPPNGRVVFILTTLLSSAHYFCDPNYVLVGEARRICHPDGWSGEEPICRPLECPVLLPPANGNIVVPSVRSVGSVATYSCDPGFILSGLESRTCQRDQEWFGFAPTCVPDTVVCENLSDPINGRVMMFGNTEGSSSMYTCDVGFALVGVVTRTCQSTGLWSDSAPICEAIECVVLSDIDNGAVDLSGTSPGSTASYSCIDGYTLSSNAVRECQNNGLWTGTEPVCIIRDCGNLLPPANGDIEFTSGSTTFGSIVTYTCNSGFTLDGLNTRQCQASGFWSGVEPSCRRIVIVLCPELLNPDNGLVTFSSRRPGSRATYTCDVGFILDGNVARVCQSTGIWTGSEPTCLLAPIDCGDLPNPENGRVSLTTSTLGSPATYTCNLGFQLIGVEVRICVETGLWSDEAPVCEPDVCPDLDDPDNGAVALSGNIFGSTATYTCNAGFVLSGESNQRVCLTGGIWSGSEPTCTRPLPGCGDPGTPVNGRRIGDDFSSGSVVFFRCFDNFDLVGSKFRVCQDNGEWSGIQPTCTPFDDTCIAGVDHYDRCGRRCRCVGDRFVECCRVRRDYAGLSSEDRLEFINTYLEAIRDPIYGPRYRSLVDTYTRSYSNNITQSTLASESQYFVFNRYFMLEFEDLLRDFKCSLTIPFYDWTPFPVAPYTAAVWGNTDGFGDTSRLSDGCVSTGPFRVGEYSINPSAGGGCLKRDYMNQRFPSRDIVERDLLPYPSSQFDSFHRFLQLFIGVNIQCFIGGTICSFNAANDPIYLLHIAQIDSIFMRWQSFGQGRDTVRYSADVSLLLESPGLRVQQFSNSLSLPYQTCIFYDPPVLLKNHAPPSSLQTLGDPVQIRTMDCNPMSSMGFMNLSQDDTAFMSSHCKRLRVFRSIRNVPTKN